jgi:CHAT domain-containing protein
LQTNDHEVLSDKYQLIQLNTTASAVNQSENFIDTSDKVYLYGGIKYDVDSATLKQAVAEYHIKSENKSFIPAYATRGNDLTYLSYTEKEINEIENLSAQKNYPVTVLSGTSASEESIKALNGNASPSVLHIATHGFFFPDPKEKRKNNINY